MRALVVGDVHGEFELLAAWAAAVVEVHGPLDAILAVGDVEPNRDDADAAGVHGPAKYRKLGDFPLLAGGLLKLGAPLYFIGGNHEPWPALDAAGPGWWGEHAYFLGRAGVATVAGLRVAYLSGIYSGRITEARRPVRESIRDRTYYTADEVRQVARDARRDGQVDVLLTHDWPAGVDDSPRGSTVGRPELRDLCERLRPRWHFCGHMHRRHSASIDATDVVCLDHIRGGRSAFALIEDTPGERVSLTGLAADVRPAR
jgi:lariat debranching enzyme